MPTFNTSTKTAYTDGSRADTQSAIDTVRDTYAEDGWHVVVGSPGMTYTWAESLTVNVGKVFTLRGADSSNRVTIKSTHGGGIGLYVNAGAKLFTLRDFQFTSWSTSSRFIEINGLGECFHLTNLYVNPTGNSYSSHWCWINGSAAGGAGPFGLVDYCHFEGPFSVFFLRQNTDSPDIAWPNNHPISWGTRDNVFIENCTRILSAPNPSAPFMDGNQSGKVVMRYNNFTNSGTGGWHGRDSGGTPGVFWKHGFLQGEVYANTFSLNTGAVNYLVVVRSGTALVHNNNLVSSGGSAQIGVHLQTHCAGGQYAAEGCLKCSDGTGMTAPLSYPSDYPDCQQAGLPQPVRVWSNTINGLSSSNPVALNYGWAGGDSDFTLSGREFHVSDNDSARPAGYTEFPTPHPLSTGSTPSLPATIVPPSITGTAMAGQTLTTTDGRFSGYPVPTKSIQWQRGDESGNNPVNISGATAANYTAVAPDIGAKVRSSVTASNEMGSVTSYSAWSEVVASPGAGNRILNPGFESRTGAVDGNSNDATFENWGIQYGNGYVQASTDRHGGAYAFRIYFNGGHSRIAQGFMTSAPGSTMSMSFWSKNDTVGRGVMYEIWDATNNAFIIPPTEVDHASWTKTEDEFIIPVSPLPCTFAYITFHTDALIAACNMWVDDVSVTPPAIVIPPPTPKRAFFSL